MNNNWKEVVLEAADESVKMPRLEPISNIGAKVLIEFIEETLASQRKEWVEAIEGMKRSGVVEYSQGYNAALDSVASLIAEED